MLFRSATEARWSLDGLDEAPLASMWGNAKNPLQIGHYHSWIVDESAAPEPAQTAPIPMILAARAHM